VGGLEGQGQRELFLTLFDASDFTGGEILVDGERTKIRNPSDAIQAGLGIALIPEDRKSAHYALLGNEVYIAENLKDLDRLPHFCLFAAFPLKIKGGSGSPVRAVALVPH
jgi:kynurenine formamidase